MEPLKFNLRINTIPVTLQNGDGKEVSLELREMSAATRDQYLDFLANRMEIDASGKTSLKKIEGMQSNLLAKCLFQDGKLVPEKEIQGWPAGTVSDLFKAAQQLNRLEQQRPEPETKND